MCESIGEIFVFPIKRGGEVAAVSSLQCKFNWRWNTISPFTKFGETETTIRVFNIPNLSSHELSNFHDNHGTMVQIVVTNWRVHQFTID